MSIKKISSTLTGIGLAMSFIVQTVQANCVTEAMGAIPYFDSVEGELVLPLVELSGTESENGQFLAALLQFQPNSSPPSFILSQPFTNPGEDCEYISIPVANFDINTQQLHIPNVAVLNGSDEVTFYNVRFTLSNNLLTVIPSSLEIGEGRYSGVVYNQETQQPLKDARVSLNGVAAEQVTNAAGHFTITGIGNSICQTLTINGDSFAPTVKEVDIRFGGLQACESAEQ